MSHKAAFRQVLREYDIARNRADFLLQERKKQMYKNIPRIAEIDKQLGKLGASLPRLALAGDYNGLNKTRTQISQIKEERLGLLKRQGISDNYLTSIYSCPECQDSGYIQDSRCACFQQKLINEYYTLSNLKEILKDENFDNCRWEIFSEKIDEKRGHSPTTYMRDVVFNNAYDFVDSFDSTFGNLYLYGSAGLGKTFLCHCIAKELLDNGKTVLYLTALRLFKVLEDYRFNRDSLSEPDEMIEAIDCVDLLVIDDLGSEISTRVTDAGLFDIINHRLVTRKSTIISTNLSIDELKKQYTERLSSRISGNYDIIEFWGNDLRERNVNKKTVLQRI